MPSLTKLSSPSDKNGIYIYYKTLFFKIVTITDHTQKDERVNYFMKSTSQLISKWGDLFEDRKSP